MTVPLSPGSPRALAATRFGAELRKAMLARKAGARRVAEAAGVAISAIANWKGGGNLPRTDTAARLAEVLDWPKLLVISREGRTLTCARCRRRFVHEGGAPKHYCSPACRDVDQQARRPQAGAELAAAVRAELERKAGVKGGIPKAPLAAALARWSAGESRRVMRRDKVLEQLGGVQAAVGAMCAACEPEGLCRDASCPLRPVSPLPVTGAEPRGQLRPVEGAWGPSHREHQLAAIREANGRRWSRPGERERQGEITRARHAAQTDEERAARGRRISERRRKAVPA